uniref:Methyltransferase-like protein 7A n=1 Tax=Callorhinchus milii TaxID=7868 RepID=V9LBR7_CALMI
MALVEFVLRSLLELLVLPISLLSWLGLWDPLYKRFFPVILNRCVVEYNQKMGKAKKELFANLPQLGSAKGLTILELGCGTGSNFEFFPQGSKLVCVDPNPHFESYLTRSKAQNKHLTFQRFLVAKGEDLSQVDSGSVDAVVCTLVLCTVTDTDKVLKEILRVLRPGGIFYFMEHVVGDKTSWMRVVQYVIQPVWRYFGDGCDLNRATWENLDKAGFSELNLRHVMTNLNMAVVRPHIVGYAVK